MFALKVCRFMPRAQRILQSLNLNKGFPALALRQMDLARFGKGARMFSASTLKEKVNETDELVAPNKKMEDNEENDDLMSQGNLEGVDTSAIGGGASETLSKDFEDEDDSEGEMSDDGVDGEYAGTASKYYRFQ